MLDHVKNPPETHEITPAVVQSPGTAFNTKQGRILDTPYRQYQKNTPQEIKDGSAYVANNESPPDFTSNIEPVNNPDEFLKGWMNDSAQNNNNTGLITKGEFKGLYTNAEFIENGYPMYGAEQRMWDNSDGKGLW